MIYKHERPVTSARKMQEWLVEAAEELAHAHHELDVAGVPNVNVDEGGVEFTLAARIMYLASTATGQQEAVADPSPETAPAAVPTTGVDDVARFQIENVTELIVAAKSLATWTYQYDDKGYRMPAEVREAQERVHAALAALETKAEQ